MTQILSIWQRDYIPDITNKDIKELYSEFTDDSSTREPDFHYSKKGTIFYLDDIPVSDFHIKRDNLCHGESKIYYDDNIIKIFAQKIPVS